MNVNALIRSPCGATRRWKARHSTSKPPLPEIALVLVRFNHIASRIVNANDGINPFVLEGLVKTYIIREWSDSLLPE
jgi:hypothetical protein